MIFSHRPSPFVMYYFEITLYSSLQLDSHLFFQCPTFVSVFGEMQSCSKACAYYLQFLFIFLSMRPALMSQCEVANPPGATPYSQYIGTAARNPKLGHPAICALKQRLVLSGVRFGSWGKWELSCHKVYDLLFLFSVGSYGTGACEVDWIFPLHLWKL